MRNQTSRQGRKAAAIYCRISEDRTGAGLGVERQREECVALAASLGLRVVETFTDNDISAYSGKPRPGYLALLDSIRSGSVDTVLAWHEDRLHRSPRELEDYIDACQPRRVPTLFVQSGELDLSTSSGRMNARIRGAVARQESEHKSERVTAAAAQRAKKGAPSGALGYGWSKLAGQIVEVPSEAAVVREIVERVANRETLLAITADLNAREVPSPEASMWDRLSEAEQGQRLAKGRKEPVREWGKTSVKKLALRPSNVALRVHHKAGNLRPEFGKVPVGDRKPSMYYTEADQQVTDGAWPALVERTIWEDACRVLAEPSRRSNGGIRPGARTHLLTWGIGECGICGGRLRVQRKKPGKYGQKVQVLYVCEKGCTGRNQANVDALVGIVVSRRIAQPDALDWMLGDEAAAKDAERRVREYQQQLDEARDLFVKRAIPATMLAEIVAEVEPQLQAAEADRERALGSRDLSRLVEIAGPAAVERWAEMTVVQQRAALEALGVRVVIDRARKGAGFDPESVRILWPTA